MTATALRFAALARRDLRVELTYQFQMLLRWCNIALGIAMFFFLGRLIGGTPALADLRGGYFAFVLVGLILANYASTCATAFNQSIANAQADDTLEVLLASPTGLGTLLGGTLIVPLLFATLDGLVYVVLGTLLSGQALDARGILVALPILVLTLGTFCALGILSATVILLSKRGDPFSSLVIQGSNLLAGAVFPVAVLPEALQALARLVPAFYGLRSMREALLADAGFADVAGDALILAGFNVVLLPAALYAFTRAVEIARVTGTLGNR